MDASPLVAAKLAQTQLQVSLMAMKQAAQAQRQISDMLANQTAQGSQALSSPGNPAGLGVNVDTYA